MKKILFPILATVLIAFAIVPLTAGTVHADNEQITFNEIKYTLNDEEQIAVVSGHTNDLPANVTIPAKVTNDGKEYTVTSIGDSAFWNAGLESVTFASNAELKTIGQSAFSDCNSLKTITIPASVTSIGQSAFSACYSLKTITIPASVTSIGQSAFLNTGLESVTFASNAELKTIGQSAFSDCYSLKTITIPASVTDIGQSAFRLCKNLTAITIPAGVTSIGEGAFSNSGLGSVTFETGTSLEVIRKSAFSSCGNLKAITIPASVTSLGVNAFANSGLQSVTFEAGCHLETIGDKVFLNCSSLTDITMPAGVESFGNGAFMRCISLKNFTIPAGVTSIGESAFANSGLALIHYLGDETAWGSVTKGNNWAPDPAPAVHYVPNKTTRKATPDADGCIDRYLCNEAGCGDWGYGGTVIPRLDQFTLSETSYTYDGTVKTPTVTVKDAAGQTIEASNYNVTIKNSAGDVVTEPRDEGTYKVHIVMQGDKYEGTKVLAYTIGDLTSIQDVEVVLSAKTYTYNGTVQKPTIGTIGGMELTEGSDYTAEWSNESSTNAGTYTVTITAKDFYTGTTSASYTIDPKAVTPTVKVSNKVYTGKALKPVVTVRAGTVTFKNGTDYTVGYSNNTKVGKASAKVTMKGNYKGSKTATFKILPKKAGISKAVPGKKLVKVTMSTKVSATGGTVYQIQYRIKGAAKWKTTTTKNKTKTIKKLKKGKQYQIRVRAYKSVSGSKYYGAWSKVKTTKKVK